MKTKLCATVVLVLAQLAGINSVHAGGLVAAWGSDSDGQLVIPKGLNDVKAIAAGQNTCPQSIALRSDGTVVVWPDTNDIPAGMSGVNAVAQGYYFRLALKSDGRVAAWGIRRIWTNGRAGKHHKCSGHRGGFNSQSGVNVERKGGGVGK